MITDYISQPATFWRASVVKDVGHMDDSLHYAMDYEYWLRLYSKYPPLFVPEYLAAFKIHPQSKNSSSGHKDVYIEEELAVIQRYTKSRMLLRLHNLHRSLMTSVYSMLNG